MKMETWIADFKERIKQLEEGLVLLKENDIKIKVDYPVSACFELNDELLGSIKGQIIKYNEDRIASLEEKIKALEGELEDEARDGDNKQVREGGEIGGGTTDSSKWTQYEIDRKQRVRDKVASDMRKVADAISNMKRARAEGGRG